MPVLPIRRSNLSGASAKIKEIKQIRHDRVVRVAGQPVYASSMAQVFSSSSDTNSRDMAWVALSTTGGATPAS